MLILWKPANPTSFKATHNGVELVLAEDHEGKWYFTADGKRLTGWWTTSRNAKEAAERIAEKHLRAAMSTVPTATQKLNGLQEFIVRRTVSPVSHKNTSSAIPGRV